MKSLSVLVAFLAGAAIGSSISFVILKKKYDERMEEKFNKMVKELQNPEVTVFFNSLKEEPESSSKKENKPKATFNNYSGIIKSSGYSNDEEEDDEILVNDLTGDPDALPVIIPPDEFGDEETYAQISLLYYADGVLADEQDHPFRSYDVICKDFEEHFGEYEDDSVYIRNDRLRTYYEILRSEKTYEEIIRKRPYLIKEDDDD